MRILHAIQRLTRLQLMAGAVALTMGVTECVVAFMGWLLLGTVPWHYFVTGAVASLIASTAMVVLVTDFVRELDARRNALQSRLQNAMFETSPLGVLMTDPTMKVLRSNRLMQGWLGYTEAQLSQLSLPALIHPDDQLRMAPMWRDVATDAQDPPALAVRLVQRQGGVVWVELAFSNLPEVRGASAGVLVLATDITKRMASEREIRRLAFFDPLTELPNRRMMQERLGQALAESERAGEHGAVVFIDLDNFKAVNDTRGHDLGDELLKQVALRITTCLSPFDTLARLGGDEFVVILEKLGRVPFEATGLVQTVCQRILAALGSDVLLNGTGYQCRASLGAALFNGQTLGSDELLKRADIAMYQSKAAGRFTWRLYEPEMQRVVTERATLETDLREAVAQHALSFLLQPQVEGPDHILGAEVLLRWNHAGRGAVPVAEFVPLAEELGLIVAVGNDLLESACAQLKRWAQHPATEHLQLSINVSPRQFHQPDFTETVSSAVRRHGIDPRRLKLELTESLVARDVDEITRKMRLLRDTGVRFAIDDFGTGHSSLAYLTRLPVSQLKIDQSFVRNIGVRRSDEVIVKTIIDMARNLGFEVIAEGVETRAQRDFLWAQGCPTIQGFLNGQPMSVGEFEAKVFAQHGRAAQDADRVAADAGLPDVNASGNVVPLRSKTP